MKITTESDIWAHPSDVQPITSAATSINRHTMPRLFRMVADQMEPKTRNGDIGGGLFDNATKFLRGHGVENVIYDPYNRSKEHNDAAVAKIRGSQCDTVTCANVLNVIREALARRRVILQAADAVKFTGTAWFWVYEGNKSGYGCVTRCGWQNHRKAETYIEELHAGFGHVERRGPLLICKLPKL